MLWLRLKRLLLLFWALWLSLVVATNVLDALRASGHLRSDFPFASGNYETMQKVLAPFALPAETAGWLFAGVILWEAVAMLLLWHSALTYRGLYLSRRSLVATFAVNLSLWGAFQLACEAFPSLLSFQIESTHRSLFTAQLATLLAIVLLPESDEVSR